MKNIFKIKQGGIGYARTKFNRTNTLFALGAFLLVAIMAALSSTGLEGLVYAGGAVLATAPLAVINTKSFDGFMTSKGFTEEVKSTMAAEQLAGLYNEYNDIKRQEIETAIYNVKQGKS